MNMKIMKLILGICHFHFQIYHLKKSFYPDSSEDTSVVLYQNAVVSFLKN